MLTYKSIIMDGQQFEIYTQLLAQLAQEGRQASQYAVQCFERTAPIRPHASESVRPCFPHGARKRPLGKKAAEVASSGGLI